MGRAGFCEARPVCSGWTEEAGPGARAVVYDHVTLITHNMRSPELFAKGQLSH